MGEREGAILGRPSRDVTAYKQRGSRGDLLVAVAAVNTLEAVH